MKNAIIKTVTIYQLITGLFILLSPVPINIARLGIFYQLFSNHYLGGILMILGAVLAAYALMLKHKQAFWLFLPQYLFLLFSAGSIVAYIVQQHYADGVVRSWIFIFMDQLLVLIVSGFYTFAIFKKENLIKR